MILIISFFNINTNVIFINTWFKF